MCACTLVTTDTLVKNEYSCTPRNVQNHNVGHVSSSTKMVSASVDVESSDNDVGRPVSSADTAASSQSGETSASSACRRSSKPSLPSTTVPPQPSSLSTLPVPPMVCALQNKIFTN